MPVLPRIKNYAELSRLSNIPTCATNVLTGVALAAAADFDWVAFALVTPAVMLLYVGGMALNDVLDVDVDREERPGRPIPSGRISLDAAKRYVWFTMSAGLGIIALQGPVAFGFGLALVVCIVLYDVFHKRTGLTVLLMGACRGLVYLVAAAAAGGPADWRVSVTFAVTLAVYISLVSVVARVEVSSRPRRRFLVALVVPVVALTPALVVRPAPDALLVAAALMLVGWLALTARHLFTRPPRIGPTVLGWLAGLCLLDGFYLVLLAQPVAPGIAAACFVATLAWHRKIAGT